MDKGIQCNTLNIYIQELICEIDNLIAEKDDMVEDENDNVHVKKILDFEEMLKVVFIIKNKEI